MSCIHCEKYKPGRLVLNGREINCFNCNSGRPRFSTGSWVVWRAKRYSINSFIPGILPDLNAYTVIDGNNGFSIVPESELSLCPDQPAPPKDARQRVFIASSGNDDRVVKRIYAELRNSGFAPWLESYDVLPGKNYEKARRKAITGARVALAFFSRKSVNSRGSLQRNYQKVIDDLSDAESKGMFVIPVKIDDCEMIYQYRDVECVSLLEAGGMEKIIKVLNSFFGTSSDVPVNDKTIVRR